ncbi:hypothetical protein [Candidatus Chlorohelix sp.]|uniref:hypothetical protein n=1 Tax=Candidatus Chlorohelix sp. TaxID=3139201 RepID=UPI0030412B61
MDANRQIKQEAARLEEAISYYHSLITGSPELADDSWQMLLDGMPPRKLTFGGKPLCNVLRPHFTTRVHFNYIREVCNALTGAIARLGDVMLGSDKAESERLLADVGLTEEEHRLLAFDTGYKRLSAHSRLDSFLSVDADGLTMHFVEYNAESPAGATYEDGLSELFTTLPVMKKFTEKYQLSHIDVKPKLLDMLLNNYREYLGTRPTRVPQVAIVDWDDVPTRTEFELLQEHFGQRGVKAIICDPRELTYTDGKLRKDDFEIDLILKRVLGSELIERAAECKPVFKAYEEGAVCMINSFRCKIFHKKMIFGLLTDEQNHRYFSSLQLELIEKHVPWTRRVREGKTTYKGEEIDLRAFVMQNRDRLVLKPNDEYGGKGITIGWESESDAWEKAFDAALPEPFVVQEKVKVAKELYPVLNNGETVLAERLVDCDPYIFDSEVAGLLTRLSAASLLNVTAGTGSTVPTFVIE